MLTLVVDNDARARRVAAIRTHLDNLFHQGRTNTLEYASLKHDLKELWRQNHV